MTPERAASISDLLDEARRYGRAARQLRFMHNDPQAARSFAISASCTLELLRLELGLPRGRDRWN